MKVTVIPIVVGALGTIHEGLVKGLDDFEIRGQVKTIQNDNIIKIGQNTEKSPGEKFLKEYKNNNSNNTVILRYTWIPNSRLDNQT